MTYPDPISNYLAEAIPRVKYNNDRMLRRFGLLSNSTYAGIHYINHTYSSIYKPTNVYNHFVQRWLDMPDGKYDAN